MASSNTDPKVIVDDDDVLRTLGKTVPANITTQKQLKDALDVFRGNLAILLDAGTRVHSASDAADALMIQFSHIMSAAGRVGTSKSNDAVNMTVDESKQLGGIMRKYLKAIDLTLPDKSLLPLTWGAVNFSKGFSPNEVWKASMKRTTAKGVTDAPIFAYPAAIIDHIARLHAAYLATKIDRDYVEALVSLGANPSEDFTYAGRYGSPLDAIAAIIRLPKYTFGQLFQDTTMQSEHEKGEYIVCSSDHMNYAMRAAVNMSCILGHATKRKVQDEEGGQAFDGHSYTIGLDTPFARIINLVIRGDHGFLGEDDINQIKRQIGNNAKDGDISDYLKDKYRFILNERVLTDLVGQYNTPWKNLVRDSDSLFIPKTTVIDELEPRLRVTVPKQSTEYTLFMHIFRHYDDVDKLLTRYEDDMDGFTKNLNDGRTGLHKRICKHFEFPDDVTISKAKATECYRSLDNMLVLVKYAYQHYTCISVLELMAEATYNPWAVNRNKSRGH